MRRFLVVVGGVSALLAVGCGSPPRATSSPPWPGTPAVGPVLGQPAIAPPAAPPGGGLEPPSAAPVRPGGPAWVASDYERFLSAGPVQGREPSWVEGGFDDVGQIATLITAGALIPVIAAGDVDDIESVGDVFQWALPLSAMGLTVPGRDSSGAWMFTKSFVASTATVAVGKEVAEKWRPNAASNKSFPSGHSAAAFSAASFVNRRYGMRFGVPYYLMALYTAYSRVQADKHHVDDVLAGASLSLMYNWAFVSPISSSYSVRPLVLDDGGLALSVEWSPSSKSRTRGERYIADAQKPFKRRYRYEFEFGSEWQEKNVVQAPSSTGTPVDYADFDGTSNPTTTASVNFQYFVADRHEIGFRWWPFEARDFTRFSSPVTLGNGTIPAGVETRTAFRLNDWRVRYRYDWVDRKHLDVKVGAGATFQIFDAELDTGTDFAEVEDFSTLPLVHLHLGYKFLDRWKLLAEVDGMYLNTDSNLEAHGLLRYQISPRWDVGIGYRLYLREIETDDLGNELIAHRAVVQLGYAF